MERLAVAREMQLLGWLQGNRARQPAPQARFNQFSSQGHIRGKSNRAAALAVRLNSVCTSATCSPALRWLLRIQPTAGCSAVDVVPMLAPATTQTAHSPDRICWVTASTARPLTTEEDCSATLTSTPKSKAAVGDDKSESQPEACCVAPAGLFPLNTDAIKKLFQYKHLRLLIPDV